MSQRKVLVFGAGAWGTALALALRRARSEVILLPKFEAERQALNERRENLDWLPGVPLPSDLVIGPTMEAVKECPALFEEAQAVFWTVPVQFSVAEAQALQEVFSPLIPLAICSKGLLLTEGDEAKEDIFLSNAFRKIFSNPLACLSGPNFAKEVAENASTASVIASSHLGTAKHIASLLASPHFKTFVSTDMISVQVAGALKNVLALACGLVMGLGLGQNTRAFLFSLGFSELCQISQKLGGRLETLLGLSGLGDVTLTCFSEKSRNTSFGLRLGRGTPLATLQSEKGGVVEGAFTAKPVPALARRLGLNTPLFDAVYRVLYEGEAPLQAIQNVLEDASITLEPLSQGEKPCLNFDSAPILPRASTI